MLLPGFLKENDKIALVAPSGRLQKYELDSALKYISDWGFEAEFGKNIFKDFYMGYHYAGTDKERAEDFQDALDNPEIKAIWCCRGGYGSVKIIDRLNFDKFLENPKWIIGYSDISIFHNHVNNLGVASIHGITAKKLNGVQYSAKSHESLGKLLKGKFPNYKINAHPLNIAGRVKGKLVGGNLSLIYSQLGSPSEIEGNNLILFIEDWCENWYHVDRMMMNLKRSGLLNRLSGIVVGAFNRMETVGENPEFFENFDPMTYHIIYQYIKPCNIPVAYGFPAGHIGDNRALLLGAEAELDVTENSVNLSFKA